MSTVTSERGVWGAWENLIARECADLANAGVCLVQENHDDAYHAKKSKPDFSGFFEAGARSYGFTPGTHVVFDAKATKQANLSLSERVVKAHQLAHLRRADAAGGVAFLYVLWARDESKWIFPIWYVDEIRAMRSSVPFEHEPFRKQSGEHWVQAVERMMREGEWLF